MKAIMISIKPKYVAKILNGEKTIEIRKTMPKCDLPIDVYIYCTKKEYLIDTDKGYFSTNNGLMQLGYYRRIRNINGKVVAKFTFNKAEHFEKEYLSRVIEDYYYDNGKPLNKKFYKKTCLTEKELFDYIGSDSGYAWHIDNLVIFDEPKKLSEFYKGFERKYYKNHFAQDIHKEKNAIVQPIKCGYEYTYPLKKAPQSWCYCEVEE